jgi:hypothetical protein
MAATNWARPTHLTLGFQVSIIDVLLAQCYFTTQYPIHGVHPYHAAGHQRETSFTYQHHDQMMLMGVHRLRTNQDSGDEGQHRHAG